MKRIIFLFTVSAVFFTSCQRALSTEASKIKKGMVKVMIMYPNSEGKTFDMDYYTNKHMPMVAELMGSSLREMSIDKGISGRTPDEPIPYLAIGYLYFDQLSDYQEAFGSNAEKIVSDIPNYTNIQPVIQIGEVMR